MTVLKGNEWREYLLAHNLRNKDQMEIYHCTYKYKAIYKVGEYFFIFGMNRGYKNISRLKALI